MKEVDKKKNPGLAKLPKKLETKWVTRKKVALSKKWVVA